MKIMGVSGLKVPGNEKRMCPWWTDWFELHICTKKLIKEEGHLYAIPTGWEPLEEFKIYEDEEMWISIAMRAANAMAWWEPMDKQQAKLWLLVFNKSRDKWQQTIKSA